MRTQRKKRGTAVPVCPPSEGGRSEIFEDNSSVKLAQMYYDAALDKTERIPLSVSLKTLARLVDLSHRHLKRLDAKRRIPGRFVVGVRSVRFRFDVIVEWISQGTPADFNEDEFYALKEMTRQFDPDTF